MSDTAVILLFIFAVLVLFSIDNWILTYLKLRETKVKGVQP